MTDDVLTSVIWIIGVIAFYIWGRIVINEFFNAIERSAELEESEVKNDKN